MEQKYGQQQQPPQQQPQVVYQSPGQQTMVQAQPVSTLTLMTGFPARLGPFPIQCVCPFCQATVSTRTESSCNCCMYCLTGYWSQCYPALQDQTHFCPNCNQMIGVYKPDE